MTDYNCKYCNTLTKHSPLMEQLLWKVNRGFYNHLEKQFKRLSLENAHFIILRGGEKWEENNVKLAIHIVRNLVDTGEARIFISVKKSSFAPNEEVLAALSFKKKERTGCFERNIFVGRSDLCISIRPSPESRVHDPCCFFGDLENYRESLELAKHMEEVSLQFFINHKGSYKQTVIERGTLHFKIIVFQNNVFDKCIIPIVLEEESKVFVSIEIQPLLEINEPKKDINYRYNK